MKPQHRHIIREELLRSIAWIALGIVGWSIMIREVAWLDTTAQTVFGLPVLTWAVLTLSAIGVRTATSKELQIQTPDGLLISVLFGIIPGGVGAVYVVTAGGYAVLWVTAAYVAVTGATVTWYWFVRQSATTSEMIA